MSEFTDHMSEPQARAAVDVWRSLLIRYEGGSVWACADYDPAHLAMLVDLFTQLTLDSMIREAQARGLDAEAARADTGQLLHEHLGELELAMVERGWGVCPVRFADAGEPAPDDL